MRSLDDALLPLLAATLCAKDSDTSYIRNACFVGGYLGVLGRGTFQQIFEDGAPGRILQSVNIEAHLKYLILCRIFHFTEDILTATRITENAQSQLAYAAAVILHFELRSFYSFSNTESITALQVRTIFRLR
jgi:hypothetical protein